MATAIVPVRLSDIDQLVRISKKTFAESHGHSASASDIEEYMSKNLNTYVIDEELRSSGNYFYFILKEQKLAGYSKIILDQTHPSIALQPVAKFERLYLLGEFYGLGLGDELFAHNLDIARSNHQKGMWLFVWVENERALRFYQKHDFQIIDQQDFKISENHANPNHLMWRKLLS
jgi:ribosomal protein S18 acetylase RimI-like enzyme